jgi:hypothetical protein
LTKLTRTDWKNASLVTVSLLLEIELVHQVADNAGKKFALHDRE